MAWPRRETISERRQRGRERRERAAWLGTDETSIRMIREQALRGENGPRLAREWGISSADMRAILHAIGLRWSKSRRCWVEEQTHDREGQS